MLIWPVLAVTWVLIIVTNVLTWRGWRAYRRAARNRHDSETVASFAALPTGFAITGTGTPAEPRTSSGMRETTADVPILAFKRYGLAWGPGGDFWLQSSYASERVKADADAQCGKHTYAFAGDRVEPHEAPSANCTCGFYATRSDEGAYGVVAVEVELSGRVIVHEHGYRAEHQRIVKARFGCWYCGEPAEVVGLHRQEQTQPGSTIGSTLIPPRTYESVTPRPYCATHLPPDEITVATEVVNRRLGIEVEWSAA